MALRLNNVTKSFSDRVILSNFSHTFDENGIYFIVGESGIGKTTLLRIIAGLDTDFTGNVENGGIKNTSVMFQEYRLFPMISALKNASVAQKDTSSECAKDILRRLGFKEEDLKKKPHELSGGMKQRVAFARAVLKDAPILVLDEPTKELDSETAKVMIDIIIEQSRHRLLLIVTHDNLVDIVKESKVIHLK